MQNALTFMNLQLHHVVSDDTGVTGAERGSPSRLFLSA